MPSSEWSNCVTLSLTHKKKEDSIRGIFLFSSSLSWAAMKRSNCALCVKVGGKKGEKKEIYPAVLFKGGLWHFSVLVLAFPLSLRQLRRRSAVWSIINKSNLNTQHKPQGKCLGSAVVWGWEARSLPRLSLKWHNKAKYQFYKGSRRLDCLMGAKGRKNKRFWAFLPYSIFLSAFMTCIRTLTLSHTQ